MVLMLKANHMFLECFYVILKQLKYFHRRLNIVLTLDPDRQSLRAKCVQFLVKFTE